MSARDIRVVVQQPALPKYRVPVFRELARRPGITLRLLYSSVPGLTNVEPDGFAGEYVPTSRLQIRGRSIGWQQSQLSGAAPHTADVLVLSWDLNFLSLLPALVRARMNGVGTILWGHGYSKNEVPWRARMRRTVARLADAVMFYNHGTARQFVDAFGWKPSRVFVALNSLDQAPIEAARQQWLDRPEALEQFRREKDLGDGPVVLFVSRLEAENRVDLLIDAAGSLIKDFPGLKIIIVGKGPDQPRLQALARRHRLEASVRFLGAIYGEPELAPWFLSSDVFCYPANIGLSLLHAFGYGLPAVTSAQIESQNPEIEALRPEENGLLYAHGDVASLAGALRRLFTDRSLRDRLAENALATVRSEFCLERMVDGFERAIRFAAGRQQRYTPGQVSDVAVIANADAPYRRHLHLRIAREIPEIRLHQFFTHGSGDSDWSMGSAGELQTARFGDDESVADQNDPSNVMHEWRKGGRIIRELIRRNVQAVVLLGYNDAARLRVIRWCRSQRIPCFIWGDSNIRCDTATGRRARVKRAVLSRILSWTSGTLACGSAGMEYFRKYGVDSDRCFRWTLEPDYALMQSPSAQKMTDAEIRWPARAGRRRLIYSGRLAPVKRVDLLIDAFAAIAARRPEWDLLIAGGGALEAKLRHRVPPKLRDRVTFTGFIDDQPLLGALYRQCDALVLPSDYEPWALVINEALAAGLAVVASDVVGAAVDLVGDGVNGRIFRHGEVDHLAECLLDVTDLDRLAAMKRASIDRLEQWRREADPVEGFREVLRFSGLLPSVSSSSPATPQTPGAVEPATHPG
jgi:glycosyltransferase involved in cell wall biosynthesis